MKDNSEIVLCDVCRHEIFNFWVRECEDEWYCLKCFEVFY